MKDEILELIKSDLALRKKISNIFNVPDGTVYNMANRNAYKLHNYFVVKLLMKETGKKENEIFNVIP